MAKTNPSLALDYRKKDRRKIGKTIVQTIVLLIACIILLKALVDLNKYVEPDKANWNSEGGFIALSYFGVDRSGSPKLISKKELRKQIYTLREQGYVTISQQDIIDYYKSGKKLPEKALFLMFEDGRNDSSLFAHPVLKKYNYKATFLSYANKMGNKDHKFLQPKEMLKMEKSGYWELGTNGYRLTYINIFDADGNFIGMKDEKEVPNKTTIEYYNHYLMDFIRDENMIPIENRDEMEERIKKDYRLMKDMYEEQMGYLPKTYTIMHANSLYNSMNELVTKANDQEIRQLFELHFNLEGDSYNTKQGELYNLTRTQVAPYWSTNHLLMKLKKDANHEIEFVVGDVEQANKWEVQKGAVEFIGNQMILTSPPAKEGMLYLKNSEEHDTYELNFTLLGNVVGKQSVYLRYNQNAHSYVKVALENNEVVMTERKAGASEKELARFELERVKWKEEDYAFDKATVYSKNQTLMGSRIDEEEYPLNIKGSRTFHIAIQGNRLSVHVDEQPLFLAQEFDSSIHTGGIAFGSSYYVKETEHEKNSKDDIYDAVFEDVLITTYLDTNDEIIFSNLYSGLEKSTKKIGSFIDEVIDKVIEIF